MPYLEPAVIVEEFADFTREQIRPAIEDDEQFIHAQAGSMSSTLRFLSNELREMETAVEEQASVLREALDDVDRLAGAADAGWSADVRAAVDEARTTLESAPSSLREREQALLEAANHVLEQIDESVDGEEVRELRRPMYRFVDARLDAQLEILGRGDDE